MLKEVNDVLSTLLNVICVPQGMIDTSATIHVITSKCTSCAMGKREQEKHDTKVTMFVSKFLIQESQKRYKGKLICQVYEVLYIFLKENQN